MVEMKKLTVDQRLWVLALIHEYIHGESDDKYYDFITALNANTEKDWVAQPDGYPVEDKTLVWSPDTGMRHWSIGGWMFSQGFKTDKEAEACQDIRYTKQMIKAMPVNVRLRIKNPAEDWAGINPMYDPYADVELGRVDRYFEDDQGIVDTEIIKW